MFNNDETDESSEDVRCVNDKIDLRHCPLVFASGDSISSFPISLMDHLHRSIIFLIPPCCDLMSKASYSRHHTSIGTLEEASRLIPSARLLKGPISATTT